MESKGPLIFVLDVRGIKHEKRIRNKGIGKTNKVRELDKVKVKADLFGADLDASAVRSSPNVNVLFHMRPVHCDRMLSRESPWDNHMM